MKELVAGDIGAVAKLSGTATGDTLAPDGKPVVCRPSSSPSRCWPWPWSPPPRPTRTSWRPALHRLAEEDPALRVERIDETHQTCCAGTGETHLQITLEKLTRKFGVQRGHRAGAGPLPRDDHRPADRRGPAQEADRRPRAVRRGVIDVEPLPAGLGFEFVDKIVGGAISRGYIPAVEKGIEEAMASGGAFGYPVVDVRVTLLDGKEHSVDSSEMAFKVAGRLAFRAGAGPGVPVVLEPISRLEVTVPLDLQGDVMGDLNARRGRVQRTDTAPGGEVLIVAHVPTSEVQRYAIDLRSLTGGRGRFRATHHHYDVLPPTSADAVRREVAEVALTWRPPAGSGRRSGLLDRRGDLVGGGLDHRVEAGHDLAARGDHELLEVPADVAGVALGVVGYSTSSW